MDPVTTTVLGHFQPNRPDLRDYPSNAPFVSGALLHQDQFREVDFLIDTGADITVVSPQDALFLFGIDHYQELLTRSPGVSLSGIGSGFAVTQPIQLFLFDEAGGLAGFERNATIMGLAVDSEGQPGNWSMPSLLGRDILEQFTLTISYRPPLIELVRSDER